MGFSMTLLEARHEFRGGNGRHCDYKHRKRRRAALSDIIIHCLDGFPISKRDLLNLRDEAYRLWPDRFKGCAARLENSIHADQWTKIVAWMRLYCGRKKLTDTLRDELTMALIVKAAKRIRKLPTTIYRQLRDTGDARGYLIKVPT